MTLLYVLARRNVAREAHETVHGRSLVSRDGTWYWDGHAWQPTLTADGRWRWNGRRWKPAWGHLPKPQGARARPEIAVSLLLGLLVLDLLVLVPGVGYLTPAAAAVVLLFVDARGFLTLNGLVKWRRMTFGQKLLTAFLAMVLLPVLVAGYIAQRLFGAAMAAAVPKAEHRSSPSPQFVGRIELAQPAPTPVAEAPDADSLQRGLDALLSEVRYQLPQDLLEKVRMLATSVGDVLPAYGADGLEPKDRFVVERTVTDYLPSAVRRYLKLPLAYRSVSLRDAEGKTASQVLSDQLDLLILRIGQVVDIAYRNDLQALIVHGRFLQSKFGPSRLAVRA